MKVAANSPQRVENTVGKGEIARNFPTVLSRLVLQKQGLVRERIYPYLTKVNGNLNFLLYQPLVPPPNKQQSQLLTHILSSRNAT